MVLAGGAVMLGAVGAAVSTVITLATEAGLALPAASRWVAVMLWAPWLLLSRTVAAHAPSPLAVVVPTTVAPSRMVMVEPASAAVPLINWDRELVVTVAPLIAGAAAADVSIAPSVATEISE